MSGQSLGLIETVGLAVAVEAADAAMKSANVELMGYELSKGGGLVTVKLTGEVGAINAAVAAGVASASKIGSVFAWKVIARTAAGIENMLESDETCGLESQDSTVASDGHQHTIPVWNLDATEGSSSCAEMTDTKQEHISAAEEEITANVNEDNGKKESQPARPRVKNTRR